MMPARSLAIAVALLGSAMTHAFSPSLPRSLIAEQQRSIQPFKSLALQVSTFPTGTESHSSSQEDERHEHISMPPGVHASITAINSPQELADFLNQDDRLCVIKFHAAWCKSCQKFGFKFQHLAHEKTDWVNEEGQVVQQGPMRFGSIEFGANSGMCRALQIKKLPTVHLYHKGQQLDGFPCGPAKFPLLLEKLEKYSHKVQSLEETLQQGDELMSSEEVASVLQTMMEKEASGQLESAKTKGNSGGTKTKKNWWDIPLP